MATKYTYVKHNGSWLQPQRVFIKQSGSWVPCLGIFYKDNGVWERVWPSTSGSIQTTFDEIDLSTTLNTASARTRIVISNPGDADLQITGITPTDPALFSIQIINDGMGATPSGGSPVTIAPGSTKYFEVTITAGLTDGNDTGSIAIDAITNVIGTTASKTITVNGSVGVLSATASISPPTLSFSTSLSRTSSAQTVTIRNTGQDALRITGITATTPAKFTIGLNFSGLGGTPSGGSPVSIAVGQSKTFTVTITASTTEGSDTGVISIAYLTNLQDASASGTVSVSGTVNKLSAELTPNPESVAFGTVDTNEQSSTKTVALKNTGNDTLTVNSITSTNAAKFSITVDQKSAAAGGIGPTLPTTIPAGQSKSIDIRLNAGATAGTDTGTVTIGYVKDVLNTSATTAISVTATVRQLSPGSISLSPSPMTGRVRVGVQEEIGTLRILNSGQQSITGLAFTTSAPAQWSFGAFQGPSGQPALSTPLGAGVAYELEIFVNGTTAGSGSGTINFTATSGGQSISGQVQVSVTVLPVDPPAAPICRIGLARFSTVEETQLSFKIYNEGKAPLTITSITAPPWVTSITPQTATIAAGSNANFLATKAAGTLSTSYSPTTLTVNTGELGAVIGDISVNPQTGVVSPLTGTVTGFKEIVIPAGYTTCTFDAQGGGGGGGGYNAAPAMPGQAGAKVTGSFAVTAGDVIQFGAGGGGGGGQNDVSGGQSASAGLTSGFLAYSGGFGGTAGTVGLSGTGGGGGGASVIKKNSTFLVVAAGGGGGGGAGLSAARSPKNTSNNDTNGQSGFSRHTLGFDGGGNGGGGGGTPGGSGGDYVTEGDAGGVSGSRGSSTGGSVDTSGGGAGGAAGTASSSAGSGGGGSITYTIS